MASDQSRSDDTDGSAYVTRRRLVRAGGGLALGALVVGSFYPRASTPVLAASADTWDTGSDVTVLIEDPGDPDASVSDIYLDNSVSVIALSWEEFADGADQTVQVWVDAEQVGRDRSQSLVDDTVTISGTDGSDETWALDSDFGLGDQVSIYGAESLIQPGDLHDGEELQAVEVEVQLVVQVADGAEQGLRAEATDSFRVEGAILGAGGELSFDWEGE